jgi:Ras-related protein Rab-5C
LGDTNTGKTSLVVRFASGHYKSNEVREPTIGAFFVTKRITVNSMTCKVLLWDTAGQEQYSKFASTYYNHAAAAIVAYDISQPDTLPRLSFWLEELQFNVLSGDPQRRMVICIAACKCDLVAPLKSDKSSSSALATTSMASYYHALEEGMRLAEQYGAFFIETSAKENIGIQPLFDHICTRVLQYQLEATTGTGLPIPVSVVTTGLSPKSSSQRRKSASKAANASALNNSQPTPASVVNQHNRSISGASSITLGIKNISGKSMVSKHHLVKNDVVETDESDSTLPTTDPVTLEDTILLDPNSLDRRVKSLSATTTQDENVHPTSSGMCEGSLLACGVTPDDRSSCNIM